MVSRTSRSIAAVLVVALLAGGGAAWAQQTGRSGTGTSSSTANSTKAGLKGDALIQYDAETGSIIVVTDDETNKQLKQVVESLDRPVPQVLIKVLFLEVTHGNDLDLGAEWLTQDTTTHNFSTQVDTRTAQTAFGLAGETTGGFYKIVKDDLQVTLRALSQVAKLEVLSRPSILTRNNKEASITVGNEVPFIQNSRITQDGQTINTITYDDIGIILTVTPHITEDGLVDMVVEPEISTLTGETVPISNTVNAPVIGKRSASTEVVVPNGNTVVIGGLMEDNKTKNSRKVPLLGDIPIIGAAFRRNVDYSRSLNAAR